MSTSSQEIFTQSSNGDNYADGWGGRTISGNPKRLNPGQELTITLECDLKRVKYSTNNKVYWEFEIKAERDTFYPFNKPSKKLQHLMLGFHQNL